METVAFKTFAVNLNGIASVKEFNNVVCKFDEDADLLSGHYTIDAKSIMGCFSLDLSKPVMVQLHTTDPAILKNFEESIKPFMVEEA